MDLLVHDEPTQGGATLTGGTHGREQDGTHREFEIRRGRDDHAVVATQFENAPPETFRDHGRDGASHARAAGGADNGHARIAHQGIPNRGIADDHMQEPPRRIPECTGGTREQRFAGHGTERGLFRGFPHDAVAAHQCQGRVPGPHRHREIERRYDTHDAHRVPILGHPVPGSFRGHCQSIELPGQADGEIADVDHFLDFAETLRMDLAGLEGYQRTECALVPAQFLAEETNQLASPRGRYPTPFQVRMLRGLHGPIDGHRIVGGHLRNGVAVDRRTHPQPTPTRNAAGNGQFVQDRVEFCQCTHDNLMYTYLPWVACWK